MPHDKEFQVVDRKIIKIVNIRLTMVRRYSKCLKYINSFRTTL